MFFTRVVFVLASVLSVIEGASSFNLRGTALNEIRTLLTDFTPSAATTAKAVSEKVAESKDNTFVPPVSEKKDAVEAKESTVLTTAETKTATTAGVVAAMTDVTKDMFWIDIIEKQLKGTTNEAEKTELTNTLLAKYRDLESKIKPQLQSTEKISETTSPVKSEKVSEVVGEKATAQTKDNTFVPTLAKEKVEKVSAEAKDNSFVPPKASEVAKEKVVEKVSAEAKDNTFVPTLATEKVVEKVSAEAKDNSFVPPAEVVKEKVEKVSAEAKDNTFVPAATEKVSEVVKEKIVEKVSAEAKDNTFVPPAGRF